MDNPIRTHLSDLALDDLPDAFRLRHFEPLLVKDHNRSCRHYLGQRYLGQIRAISTAAPGNWLGRNWPSLNNAAVLSRPSLSSITSTVCASGETTQTSGTPRLW